MLYNGLGRYGDALTEAQQAAAEQPELFSASWALPELIEAASRSGQAALASDAFAQLADAVSVSHTDWGYGLHSRCQALVTSGEDADLCYREAVARFDYGATVSATLHGTLSALNACVECCDRHALPGRLALFWEGRDGSTDTMSFVDLQRRSAQFANFLVGQGIRPGDCVAGLLPRIPELLIAILGI